jgi:hypothetical protein
VALWRVAESVICFPCDSITPLVLYKINGRLLWMNGCFVFGWCEVHISTQRPSSMTFAGFLSSSVKIRRWCPKLMWVQPALDKIWCHALSVWFFRRVRQMRKATFSFVMSVRLSAWNNSVPAGRIFIKFYSWIFFEKSAQKIQVSSKSDKNNGYFTWRPMYADDISLNSS